MLLSLAIEKPAAGGRMIARHDGRIVLVSGAIPGERVRARLEGTRAGVMYAATTDVEEASPDRRMPACDPACGGSVYAHVAYERQLTIKAEIVADAFARIARRPLEAAVPVLGSPERGYRMRARLHVRGGLVGFFRENTHEMCDAGSTGQLLPATIEALDRAAEALGRAGAEVQEIEVAENIPASERVVRLEMPSSAGPSAIARAVAAFEHAPFTGVVPPDRRLSIGSPHVHDTVAIRLADVEATLSLRRHVGSFFQANRYLLARLVERVLAQVPAGPLVDLYAGVGLFGLSWAALGRGPVTAIEGDRQSGEDLAANARPFAGRVVSETLPVERYLERTGVPRDATLLVDPPRTGMTKEAAAAIVSAAPPRVVYVSCDVATLARDVRRCLDTGYALEHVEAFDLFPNTAHVETLVVLTRTD